MALPQWNFRPTALALDSYKDATESSLMKHYLQDGDRVASNGGTDIPPKPQGAPGVAYLRTCQWNIHYLSAPWLYRTEMEASSQHADKVADAILKVDADVVVLNEFAFEWDDNELTKRLCGHLESAGHSIFNLCECSFPTAIVSRLPVINNSGTAFALDAARAAMQIIVNAAQRAGESVPVTIFGTHLEASDHSRGQYRRTEAKALLAKVESSTNGSDPVLLIGDFNQQRPVDYTKNEWKAICDNKAKRSSPREDGVSRLLNDAGFRCCYDQVDTETGRNWLPNDPPPATHWTSTVIDYAYSKNLSLVNVYVLPHNVSDHRMVVCDWKVNA